MVHCQALCNITWQHPIKSVIASDKDDPPNDSEPMIITINIRDINDQYPFFTQNMYHFKVFQVWIY